MFTTSIPENARVWFFAANRLLSAEERAAILNTARGFLQDWTSHGRPVPGHADLLHGHVLAISAGISENEINAGVSGCGIDSLTHAAEDMAAQVGIEWLNAMDVTYYDATDTPQFVSRAEFRRLSALGAIGADTPVLDLTPTTLVELRANGIKRRVADSWHSRLLQRKAQPA